MTLRLFLPLALLATFPGTAVAQTAAAPDPVALVDAEYDPARLAAIRAAALYYVHGHAAGGTNPALITMVGQGLPIAAWDCSYNRATTAGQAAFFDSAEGLRACLQRFADHSAARAMGAQLRAHAQARYRWADVTDGYFRLLGL